jgi:transposase
MTITMIGLDTAKAVFQVHAVDKAGNVVIRRKIQRKDLITFFEKQGSNHRHDGGVRCVPTIGG